MLPQRKSPFGLCGDIENVAKQPVLHSVAEKGSFGVRAGCVIGGSGVTGETCSVYVRLRLLQEGPGV